MNKWKFDAAAKRYPELNIYSDKFDAALALRSSAVHITIPNWKAPIYFDIAEFERTMAWKRMVRETEQQQQDSQQGKSKKKS